MDIADRAEERIEIEMERAMAARRQQPLAAESATVCDGCGEPIPQARRDALPGVRTCIQCAQEDELLRRQRVR